MLLDYIKKKFFNGNRASSLKLFGQLELYNNSSFILIWQKKYGCYRQFLCLISWKLKKTFTFETTSPNDLLLSTNVCNHLYRDSSFSFDPVMEMEMSNSCHRNLCTSSSSRYGVNSSTSVETPAHGGWTAENHPSMYN